MIIYILQKKMEETALQLLKKLFYPLEILLLMDRKYELFLNPIKLFLLKYR